MTQANEAPKDLNDARVELFARAIREGTYDPDPTLIAERLLCRALGDRSDLEDERAVASAQ